MTDSKSRDLKKRFEDAGQGHVFKYMDQLDEKEKAEFIAQLSEVDLDWVANRLEQYKNEKEGEKNLPALEPAPVITLPETAEEKEKAARARQAGEDALRQGRVAAFLVAGGQGTRLGFDGPKGCYPIGPVTDRTLFRHHAEQIQARARRYGCVIPWYIMTSKANDEATRRFFYDQKYFGFNEKDIVFFQQEMVPAIDFEGKLILDGPGSLAMNPNGHGGSLYALARSGAIEEMRQRGVDTISYFQVDNPLTTICDPTFAGYHILAGADMSSKVLEKNAPEEKVGAICYMDGKLGVVEYSDLDEENMYAKGEDGRLKFWAGSIAIHMLNVDFVESIAAGNGSLPWHVAIKKIPAFDGEKVIKPDEPNGVKFETFVFDALPFTRESITMEVVREDEFAPVKNPDGVDSAVSCRALMSDYAGRMLREAGVEVPLDSEGKTDATIELSYLYALDADELRSKLDDGFTVTAGEEITLEEKKA